MAEQHSQKDVRESFEALGLLLGRRFDIRFFEGGYTYAVVPEPSSQSAGIPGGNVVRGPAECAAAHQQPQSAWLIRQWMDVERGIFLYGNGRKGAFRRQRGLHGDGGRHV